MSDVLITPASALLQFKTGSANDTVTTFKVTDTKSLTISGSKTRISGSLILSGQLTSSAPAQFYNNINIYKSGSNASAFKVTGGNGTLFEITDQLSGSLFSVNTIAGLPLLEVFSNNKVVLGAFNTNALVVSGSRVSIGGTTSNSSRLEVSGGATLPPIRLTGLTSNPTGQYLTVDDNTGVVYKSSTAAGPQEIGRAHV